MSHPVLANDDFLNEVALAELDKLGVVERGGDLSTKHRRQTLHTSKVGVLNGQNARVGEKLSQRRKKKEKNQKKDRDRVREFVSG